jgi:SEC-C motif-containing protein
MRAPRDCPCHSGLRYAVCCSPFHRGARPDTPEALMRSRYAAFALGLGEYLVATLASSHPDLALPRVELVRDLSCVKDRQRFLGLRIVRAEGDEVLFEARIFERGQDRSFAELSTFVREEGAWKYAGGRMLRSGALPKGFTYEQFLEAAG